MTVAVDEKHGRLYDDRPWPIGYDAVAITPGEGKWQQAEVTLDCDSSVLLYEDRLPAHGRPIIATRSLSGVIYVLSLPDQLIRSRWEKKGKVLELEHRVPPAHERITIEFRDGDPIVFYEERDQPELGDRITVEEVTSTFRSHAAWTRAIEELEASDVVLDLGAHIGTFTREAMHREPRRVIAVEASSRNVELLRENVSLSSAQVTGEVIHAAVVASSPEDSVRLWVYPQNANPNRPVRMRHVSASTVRSKFKVPVAVPALEWRKALDEYEPTVVKIDTESAEVEWDFAGLPPQLRSIAIEAEINTQFKRDWYADYFEPTMKSEGFTRVEPQRLFGFYRDELWSR